MSSQNEEQKQYCNDLVERIEKIYYDSCSEDYWTGLNKAIEIIEDYFKQN